MKFTIQREDFLKPLQQIAGVVERRQTMPALSNVLIRSEARGLSFSATDLEIELVAYSDTLAEDTEACALPARKLLDICRALPDGSSINLTVSQGKGVLKANRSRFTLAAQPAETFPSLEDIPTQQKFKVPGKAFKELLHLTAFAMAQQDVRFYLNGVLLEVSEGKLTAVATDGHRLAFNEIKCDCTGSAQVIVPRKAITELQRLLGEDEELEVELGTNHVRLHLPALRFTSKLVDARYPDYHRVIPKDLSKRMLVDAEALRQALVRAAILSNEKFKGVRLSLEAGLLKLKAQNPDQESAEEELEVEYDGESLETGFNVHYLLDYIAATGTDRLEIQFKDSRSSILMKGDPKRASLYVVMPMQL